MRKLVASYLISRHAAESLFMNSEGAREVFLDYDLPPHLIAQEPLAERDAARLLVLERSTGSIRHSRFLELAGFLKTGDLVVLNDTRVVPARLLGKRSRTGGKWEGLFLRVLTDMSWEMLCQTRGRLLPGEEIDVADAGPILQVVSYAGPGRWIMKPLVPGSVFEILERFGHVPLPPYIRAGCDAPADRARYQTLHANKPGAVAAPTAGLHFTPRVFEALRARGVDWSFVTLHVGLGTFQPLKGNDFRTHVLHAEAGTLPLETGRAMAACKERGGRVIAVGTTTARVLETAAREKSLSWEGQTSLYICPPYEFQAVDGLITNFHLPRTSLLLLVQALAGSTHLRKAYMTAIEEGYRFYSYGDAMLVI